MIFFPQKIGYIQGDNLHEMSNSFFSGEIKENIPKLCLLKYLPTMLKVNIRKKKFNACNDALLHSNSKGQDQSVHPYSLIWIFLRIVPVDLYILKYPFIL